MCDRMSRRLEELIDRAPEQRTRNKTGRNHFKTSGPEATLQDGVQHHTRKTPFTISSLTLIRNRDAPPRRRAWCTHPYQSDELWRSYRSVCKWHHIRMRVSSSTMTQIRHRSSPQHLCNPDKGISNSHDFGQPELWLICSVRFGRQTQKAESQFPPAIYYT